MSILITVSGVLMEKTLHSRVPEGKAVEETGLALREVLTGLQIWGLLFCGTPGFCVEYCRDRKQVSSCPGPRELFLFWSIKPGERIKCSYLAMSKDDGIVPPIIK